MAALSLPARFKEARREIAITRKLDSWDMVLIELSALALVFIVSWIPTAFFHEAGHACACIALGGNVGGLWYWLRHGVLSFPANTDCSLKPFPPLVWAGGDIATIISWFVSVPTLAVLLNREIVKRGMSVSVLWGYWSFWSLGCLLKEVYHTYSPPSVWQDTTQFVHTTGINPNLVGIPLAAILAISLWPWWRIQYRLLPDLLLSNWDRLRTSLISKI
jgi:hypothetical protein